MVRGTFEKKTRNRALRVAGSSFLAVLAALSGPQRSAFAQSPGGDEEPAAPEPEITFFLGSGEGRPGDRVTLELGIITNVPVRKLSIALNFDETVLRFVSVLLHGADLGGAPAPAFESIDAAEFDNRDRVAGNQAAEGWVHIELGSGEPDSSLDIPLDERVTLLDLEFEIRSGAQPGFTAVTFESIVNDDVEFGNEAHAPGEDGLDGRFSPADLEEGRIEIIGEVGFFLRADVDMNCRREITDAILVLDYLFLGSAEPPCLDAADADDSGVLDISDPIVTLEWLFHGGSGVEEPLGQPSPDPTDGDALDCATGLPEEEWERCTLGP